MPISALGGCRQNKALPNTPSRLMIYGLLTSARLLKKKWVFVLTIIKGMKMYYSNENGRSMVEMLGVLAIIGVLSVGAIAGYQKAMYKYKLNRHAQQLEAFFTGLFEFTQATQHEKGWVAYEDLVPLMIKGNYIPDEMKSAGKNYAGQTQITDYFGSQIVIWYCTWNGYAIQTGAQNQDTCVNIMQALQRISSNILYVDIYRSGVRDLNPPYGRNCTSGGRYTCLADMTLKDFYNWCDCVSSNCSLRAFYYR
jgi:type II secretory pathway pseudopilin PulG